MSLDSPPQVNWLDPPEERTHARHVQLQLVLLASIEGQFLSSVRLYDHAAETVSNMKAEGRSSLNERAFVANWMNIAAQYAVLMIYHFRDALYSVKHNLEQTRALQSKADMKAVRRAIDEFEARFPHARDMRDQVGHFVDKIYTPAKLAKNKPAQTAYSHGTVDYSTRRLLFAHEGKEIWQEISYAEWDKLRTIKRAVFAAFDKTSQPPN